MKRLIDAIVELLEAKAELLREEACMLHLGKYAEGYKDGQDDANEIEYTFIDETEDD